MQEILTPDDAVRARAEAYKAAKTQQWIDAEVRWREWDEQEAREDYEEPPLR